MKQLISIIGRSEFVEFPVLGLVHVPARIDTGAKTSSVWASDIRITDGQLRFVLFDSPSKHFNGHEVVTRSFDKRMVASSNGMSEERYVVKLVVVLHGRKINASFTLADRSSQAYPVLIGRNVLRGKFLVDVSQGQPLTKAEKARSQQLQAQLPNPTEEQV